jgi:hypothetical protein
MEDKMNISKDFSHDKKKESQQPRAHRISRQKRARGFTRSNEGIARRAYQDLRSRMERVGINEFAAWFEKKAKRRRWKKARNERRKKHLARMDRDPSFRAKCEKDRLDYLCCRVHSCHNAASELEDIKRSGIERDWWPVFHHETKGRFRFMW